jgi:hypothetical protein
LIATIRGRVRRSILYFHNARNDCISRAFLLKEETTMAILQLLTPFDYALVVVLGAILVFSLMEGGSHKH